MRVACGCFDQVRQTLGPAATQTPSLGPSGWWRTVSRARIEVLWGRAASEAPVGGSVCLCQLLGLPAAPGHIPLVSSSVVTVPSVQGQVAQAPPRGPPGGQDPLGKQDSLPQLKTLNFITSAKSTLPCKVTLTDCGL